MNSREDSPSNIAPPPLKLVQRMPRCPAPSVAELSARLYAAYTVDGGGMRLAGCTLEPQPIAHARGRCLKQQSDAGAVEEQAIEMFLTATGEPLDAATIADLGLSNLVAAEKPPRLAAEEVERLMAIGRQAIESRCQQLGGALVSSDVAVDGVEVDIVWCRWAAGKLRFNIGEQFVDLPFADWAARLTPPKFVCSYSHRPTFHLAATDDGRIVAAEEVAACQQSGRRMLQGELVTCSATGRRVSPELVEICPVTEKPVLRDEMTVCPTCRLRISPKAIVVEHCLACGKLEPVKETDSRMGLVLGEHPGLDCWRRWRLAETTQAYVLEARGLVRRLLIVIDKQTLQPIRLAVRPVIRKDWTEIDPQQWPQWLR